MRGRILGKGKRRGGGKHTFFVSEALIPDPSSLEIGWGPISIASISWSIAYAWLSACIICKFKVCFWRENRMCAWMTNDRMTTTYVAEIVHGVSLDVFILFVTIGIGLLAILIFARGDSRNENEMTDEGIQNVRTYRESQGATEGGRIHLRSTDCPICISPCSYQCVTNCNHRFCSSCIVTYWRQIQSLQKVRCPCCRTEVFVRLIYAITSC
jgi:hypothetical protein